jgi:hypothetical protein
MMMGSATAQLQSTAAQSNSTLPQQAGTDGVSSNEQATKAQFAVVFQAQHDQLQHADRVHQVSDLHF